MNMSLNSDTFIADPSLKIDHVHLKVSKLDQSVNFYQNILGFKILKEEYNKNTVLLAPNTLNIKMDRKLSATESQLIVLTQLNDCDNAYSHGTKMEDGLYHFAVLLPERKYLAIFLRHIQKNLDPQYYEGMADHAVSESIYIHDPDYNGIEVYNDRSSSDWHWNGSTVHMVTEPLNVANLLRQYTQEVWGGMPYNTSIGHVHLHVSNLNRSRQFYKSNLGLNHTA